MAVKNNTSGPKALNTNKGVYILQPGAELPDGYEIGADDMAAIEAVGFLEKDGSPGRSMAELQQEIASSVPVDLTGGDSATNGDLPAEDDPAVLELKDSGTADDLRQIAKDENVALESDDNKLTMARKIIAARNA